MNINLRAYQYKRMLEEKRGHNYQYPNNEQQRKNDELGYEHHVFKKTKSGYGTLETINEEQAKEVVKSYRKNGYYSRIVCYPNEIIGVKYY